MIYKSLVRSFFTGCFKQFMSSDNDDIWDIWDAFCAKAPNYNKNNNFRIMKRLKINKNDAKKLLDLAKINNSNAFPKLSCVERLYNLWRDTAASDDCFNKFKNVVKVEIDNVSQELPQYHIEDNKILFLKSPTGTGKSKYIFKYLKEHPNATCLLISYRRAMASDCRGKYRGICFKEYRADYKKHEMIVDERVICQVESMRRVSLQSYDLVLLDEVESIVNQFTSKYTSVGTMPSIRWHLRHARKIVGIDALLKDKSILDIKNILGPKYKYNPTIIINTKKTHCNDVIDLAHTIAHAEQHVYIALDNNKKIFVFTNKIKYSKKLSLALQTKYPNKKIGIYNSETSREDMAKLEDVNKAWGDLDILIYTNTIEAGISFELSHFDIGFGMLCNNSCGIVSALQMKDRVRDVASNRIIMHIDHQPKHEPGTKKEMEYMLTRKRALLETNLNNSMELLRFDFDDIGTYVYPNEDYYYNLFVSNLANYYDDHNRFFEKYIGELNYAGIQVNLLPDPRTEQERLKLKSASSLNDVRSIMKTANKALNDKIIDDIVRAQAINPETIDDQALTKKLKDGIKKYVMMSRYDLMEEDITHQFVEKYGLPQKQVAYLTTLELLEKSDNTQRYDVDNPLPRDKYLEKIRSYELAKYNEAIQSDDILKDLRGYAPLTTVRLTLSAS